MLRSWYIMTYTTCKVSVRWCTVGWLWNTDSYFAMFQSWDRCRKKKKTHNWTLLHLWLFLHLSYNTNLDIQTVTVSPELTEAYLLHAGIVSSGNNSIHLGLLERKPRVEKWQDCCSSSPGLIIYSLWGTTAVLSISSFFLLFSLLIHIQGHSWFPRKPQVRGIETLWMALQACLLYYCDFFFFFSNC